MGLNQNPQQGGTSLLDTVTERMTTLDFDLRIQWANRAMGESVNKEPENLVGHYCYQVLHDREFPCENCPVQITIKTGEPQECEIRTPDGRYWHIRSYPLRTPGGQLEGVAELTLEITDRKRAEQKRDREVENQQILLDNIQTHVWYLIDERTYGAANKPHAEFRGLTPKDMPFKDLFDIYPENIAEIDRLGNLEVFATGEPVHTEEWLPHVSGEWLLLSISKTPIFLADGTVEYVVCSGEDITESKQMEQKHKEMNFYDSLTGLYNRNFFEEEMKRLSDGRYAPMGIIVCELDGLEFVKYTLGHKFGDHMLMNAAKILRQNLRFSDIIARIGEGTFAILFTKTEPILVDQILQRLRRNFQNYRVHDADLLLPLSLGYAVYEGTNAEMQALFRKADNRMYREKIQSEESTRDIIVRAIINSMQARDFDTEGHCDRLQQLAASLTHSLGLSQEFTNDLLLLAHFHDLGKVGIPEHILFKPGSLTEEEWRQMRQHCEIGYRIASSVPDLEPIAEWILKHHEWWDGRGYPHGLSGYDIPLPCRILSIVDAYDAMTSNRPYRNAMTSEEAIAELRRCAGTQFDPELVERFIRILEEVSDG